MKVTGIANNLEVSVDDTDDFSARKLSAKSATVSMAGHRHSDPDPSSTNAR
jgi:hypothetical protein